MSDSPPIIPRPRLVVDELEYGGGSIPVGSKRDLPDLCHTIDLRDAIELGYIVFNFRGYVWAVPTDKTP